MQELKLVKNLAFGDTARSQILTGVEKLTNAVGSTLGASGKCVILEDANGMPQITKDGVTVANAVTLQDSLENIGATLIKQAAQRTVSDAGDGTTTATVLAKAILELYTNNTLYSKKRLSTLFNHRIYNRHQIRDRYIETSYESAHLSGSASKFIYASEHCQFNNVNITEAIAGINNNIYIIQGLRCDAQPKYKCDDYKVINPAIECSTIDRTKSMPHLEKPESVLEILSVYLH